MRIIAKLHTPELKNESKLFASTVRVLCEAAIMVNREFLRTHPSTPALYRAGVRYQNEPEGTPDLLLAIPQIKDQGWGDCMHLSCWRVAELRNKGVNASIRIKWRKYPDGLRLFHVLVRHPNGSIEDPSRLLGM